MPTIPIEGEAQASTPPAALDSWCDGARRTSAAARLISVDAAFRSPTRAVGHRDGAALRSNSSSTDACGRDALPDPATTASNVLNACGGLLHEPHTTRALAPTARASAPT
jgi:hypothetical protein